MSESKNKLDWDLLIEIAQKNPLDRNSYDCEKLIELLSSIQFFYENIELKMSPEDFFHTVHKYLKYERFEQDSFIFHDNQPANKLYIILKGTVRNFELRGAKEIENEIKKKNAEQSPNQTKLEIGKEEKDFYRIKTLQKQVRLGDALSRASDELKNKLISRLGKAAHANLMNKLQAMDRPKALDLRRLSIKVSPIATNRSQNMPDDLSPTKPPGSPTKTMRRHLSKGQKSFAEVIQKAREKKDMELFKGQIKLQRQYFLSGIFKYRLTNVSRTGDILGEQALRSYKPRNFSALVSDTIHLISLSKDDFIYAATELLDSMRDKTEYFKQLLTGHEEEKSEQLSYHFSEYASKNKEVIYSQHDTPTAFYFIRSGAVTLAKDREADAELAKFAKSNESGSAFKRKDAQYTTPQSSLQNNKNLVNVVTLVEGQFFGEELILGSKFRTFTATANSSDTVLYRLSSFSYEKLKTPFEPIFNLFRELSNVKYNWREERVKELMQTEVDREVRKDLLINFAAAKMLGDKMMIVQVPMKLSMSMPILQGPHKEVKNALQRRQENRLIYKPKNKPFNPNKLKPSEPGADNSHSPFNLTCQTDNEGYVEHLKLHDSYKERFHRETFQSTISAKASLNISKEIESSHKDGSIFDLYLQDSRARRDRVAVLSRHTSPKPQVPLYTIAYKTPSSNLISREQSPTLFTEPSTNQNFMSASPGLNNSNINDQSVIEFPGAIGRHSLDVSSNSLSLPHIFMPSRAPLKVLGKDAQEELNRTNNFNYRRHSDYSLGATNTATHDTLNLAKNRKSFSVYNNVLSVEVPKMRVLSQSNISQDFEPEKKSGLDTSTSNVRTQLRNILHLLEDDPRYLTSSSKDKNNSFMMQNDGDQRSFLDTLTSPVSASKPRRPQLSNLFSNGGSHNIHSLKTKKMTAKPHLKAIDFHPQKQTHLQNEMAQIRALLSSSNVIEGDYNLVGQKPNI